MNITIVFNLKEAQRISKAAADGNDPLPFGIFGRTGGGGRTRWALVERVNARDWIAAHQLFYQLVRESIEDVARCGWEAGELLTPEDAKQQLIDYLEDGHAQWLGWAI